MFQGFKLKGLAGLMSIFLELFLRVRREVFSLELKLLGHVASGSSAQISTGYVPTCKNGSLDSICTLSTDLAFPPHAENPPPRSTVAFTWISELSVR